MDRPTDDQLRDIWSKTLPMGGRSADDPGATFRMPPPPGAGTGPGSGCDTGPGVDGFQAAPTLISAADATLLDDPALAPTIVPASDTGSRPPSAHDTAPLPGPGPAGGAAAAGYELIEEIGRGGMGVIYRARQASLRREVAAKRMRREVAASSERRRAFVSEALVNGLLDHPNIVPVHDLGQTADGELLLSMKLVGGMEWRDILHPRRDAHRERAERTDREDHLQILLAVCNAVSFAHSKGIVHLDLKPENVMVGDFGEVLVMDWGIAVDVREDRAVDEMRAPRASSITGPSGTPRYMAPEQALGEGGAIGPWTDVYLLGAILHEIVAGAPPHRGDTIREVIVAAVMSEPPRLSAEIPRELAEVCGKALAREPSERYQSVEPFRDAVQGFLKHVESLKLSDAAAATLDRCAGRASDAEADRNQLYADYAEVVAGFHQAQLLWDENPDATAGERRARFAFAEAALGGEDLGLAEAQAAVLPAADDAAIALRGRIASAAAARDRTRRAARRLRSGLAAALLLILGGLTVGFFLVNAERRKAVLAREDAVREERAARTARDGERDARLAAERDRAAAVDAHRDAVRANRETEAAREAEKREKEAAELARTAAERERSAAEEAREVARASEREATARLAWSLVAQGDARASEERWREARAHYREAAAAFAAVGEPDLGVRLGLWHALSQSPPAVHVLRGHGDLVHSAAFTPDGRQIVSSGAGTIRVWDVTTGRAVRVLDGENVKASEGVNLTPDGRALLIPGEDRIGRLVDLASGETIRTFEGHQDQLGSFAVSSDGRLAASTSFDRTVKVWDVATGALRQDLRGHTDRTRAAAFSPDGAVVASTSDDGTARLWDVATGTVQRTLTGHGGATNGVAFSPDGSRVAISSFDGAVRIWSRESGEVVETLRGHEGAVGVIDWSADGRFILSTGVDATVRLWDAETGDAVRVLEGHEPVAFTESDREFIYAPVLDGAFSPDGRLAVSTGVDGTIRVWSLGDGRGVRRSLGSSGSVMSVAVSPDGALAAVGLYDGTVRLVDVATGRDLRAFWSAEGYVFSVAFTPDGARIVAGCGYHGGKRGVVAVWDVDGDVRPAKTIVAHEDAVRRVVVSSDGATLLTASLDGTAKLFSLETLEELRTLRVPEIDEPAPEGRFAAADNVSADAFRSAAFSRDGRHVAAGDHAGRIVVWESETGKVVADIPASGFATQSLAFDRDGDRLLSCHAGRGIVVWDWAAGKVARAITEAGNVEELAISADGRWAVACGTGFFFSSGRVQVLDLTTGERVRSLPPPASPSAVAIAGDASRIIVGAYDGWLTTYDLHRLDRHLALQETVARTRAGEASAPLDADARADLGRWWALFGFHDRARELLVAARTDGADEASATDELALAHWDAGDLEAAGGELRRAMDARAAAGGAAAAALGSRRLAGLSRSHAARASVSRAAGEPAIALGHVARAIEAEPEAPDLLVLRALIQNDAGEVADAIASYSEAIELGFATAMSHQFRGDARLGLGDVAGAIADFGEAIGRSPDAAHLFLRRGKARVRAGDDEGALADFADVIRLEPTNMTAFNQRGIILERLGDLPAAIEAYSGAIAVRPGDPVLFYNRAMVRRTAGDAEGALADLDAALRQDAAYASAHNLRGHLAYERADWATAIDDYTRAIDLDLGNVDFIANRSAARRHGGDLEGAIEDAERAIANDADFARGPYELGRALLVRVQQGGDVAAAAGRAAVARFDRAIELGHAPNLSWAYKGLTHYWLLELDPAIGAFERSLEVKGDDEIVHYNLAACLALRAKDERGAALERDVDRALDHLERAIAEGYADWATLKSDADLEVLRGEERYQRLVEGH